MAEAEEEEGRGGKEERGHLAGGGGSKGWRGRGKPRLLIPYWRE